MDRTSKSRLKRCKRRFAKARPSTGTAAFSAYAQELGCRILLKCTLLAFSLAVTRQETQTTRQYVLSQVSTANSTSKTRKTTPVEVVDLLLPPHWLPRNKQRPTSVPSLTLPVLQFTLDQYKVWFTWCLLEEDHRQPQPPFKIMLLFPNKIETEEEENMVTPTRMVCISGPTAGIESKLGPHWIYRELGWIPASRRLCPAFSNMYQPDRVQLETTCVTVGGVRRASLRAKNAELLAGMHRLQDKVFCLELETRRMFLG
ncbi:hypothetical protein C8J57DRAFT_1482305 [Mycena rebaudengoi]|nr:hypothetical protein C8J57DRAFT_1482305 [Mycena rebaudengoi]